MLLLDYVKGISICKHEVDTHADVLCLLATCSAKGERMVEFNNDKNWRTHLVYDTKQKWVGFS